MNPIITISAISLIIIIPLMVSNYCLGRFNDDLREMLNERNREINRIQKELDKRYE